MALDPDVIVDRRRLRRRLSFWRILAIILVAATIGGAFMMGSERGFSRASPHIARFQIEGFISGDRSTIERLDDIAEADSVRALILEIDSPGGTTAGAEALYDAIRDVAEKKPVVAVVDTLAASGGYIAALGADRIFARGNSLVGSIGVLFQWPEAGALLDRLGINVYEVKSAPLKAEPNYFEPPSDEARAMLASLVRDTYDWFVRLVAERRGIDMAAARELGDGSIYTGRQALDSRLIDATGGEEEAQAWLADARGIDADLPVREWKPKSEGWGSSFSASAASWVAKMLGVDALAPLVARARALSLDGLVSVWHPPGPASQDGGEGLAP